jgi:hypothetical protein
MKKKLQVQDVQPVQIVQAVEQSGGRFERIERLELFEHRGSGALALSFRQRGFDGKL